MLKSILIILSPYSQVNGTYLPFALSGTQGQIIIVNNTTVLQY